MSIEHSIYVGNLSSSVTEDVLRMVCSQTSKSSTI